MDVLNVISHLDNFPIMVLVYIVNNVDCSFLAENITDQIRVTNNLEKCQDDYCTPLKRELESEIIFWSERSACAVKCPLFLGLFFFPVPHTSLPEGVVLGL